MSVSGTSVTVRDLTVPNPNQWATLTGTYPLAEVFNMFQVPDGINVFTGGINSVQVLGLNASEVAAIVQAYSNGLLSIQRVAPSIYNEFKKQLNVAIAFGAIAKAKFQNQKTINFPSQPGTIGVNWLAPQLYKYIGAATASNPGYTDYTSDSWKLSLTAGTPIQFAGNGTTWTQNTPPTTPPTITFSNFYKTNPTNGFRQISFVLQDGMIEEATTPAINQFQIATQNEQKYGIYTVDPLQDQTIQENKTIYQYPTPIGVVPFWYDVGTVWIGMPFATQTSSIRLHGLTFYEHELFPTVNYI